MKPHESHCGNVVDFKKALVIGLVSVLLSATSSRAGDPTFGQDVAFLRRHIRVMVLSEERSAAQVAIVPAWQARVMTSTAGDAGGVSFGWINRRLVANGKISSHINVFGGEDRLWLGPEGGQFSIFFAKGSPFDLEHWFVPAPLDTQPFQTVSRRRDRAKFQSRFTLVNYSGERFCVKVTREIRLLKNETVWGDLGVSPLGGVALVAYDSINTLINAGQVPWRKDTGLLSAWVLGMFKSSSGSVSVVPIKQGSESELGVQVTSDYFGSVPPDRLKVTSNAIFLRADGRFRSKIGINPRRSLATIGSYDSVNHVPTIVQFNQPADVTDYVSSLWKVHNKPFAGDAINVYNDGPPAPGVAPLGPFFELESSSPAAALEVGNELTHTRRTIHFAGAEGQLDIVARAVLGVSLADIETVLLRKEGP